MKISVCIPSRGHVGMLWATICACEQGLKGIDHEFIVHCNGKPWDEPTQLLATNSGGKVHIFRCDEPLPPPMSRNLCAEMATGDYLCFFDDHCLPDPDWFTKLLELDKDVVHSCYSTHVGYHRYYHFIHLGDPNPMIGDYSREPLSQMPYLCLSAPHGGFAVKKTVWDAIGGYGTFWRGFGGEEAYFGVKAAQAGFEVWMHPQMHFYHFSCRAETRGYDKWKEANPWNFEEAKRQLGI